jgi:NTP pyrophosphatase (non-canonical NTP hydrolase)
MDFYKKLEILASKRINTFYHTKHDFYKGSQTYFEEIHKEINEAEAENKINNKIYLEYELGDIFWDYMCLLQSLKAE